MRNSSKVVLPLPDVPMTARTWRFFPCSFCIHGTPQHDLAAIIRSSRQPEGCGLFFLQGFETFSAGTTGAQQQQADAGQRRAGTDFPLRRFMLFRRMGTRQDEGRYQQRQQFQVFHDTSLALSSMMEKYHFYVTTL
jgi:hypothetical protein